MLYGLCQEDVLRLMQARSNNNYKPEKDSDGAHLSLVVEGGALRGILSCGYAKALYQLGFHGVFDSIYATSSGALNSAYFLTGELDTALSIYYENAVDKRCANIWNYPNILDVDWLLDNWILDKKAFDIKKVLNSPTSLNVPVTDINTGKTHFFNTHAIDAATLGQVLKATSYTPMLCNQKQTIEGKTFNDGLVGAAIPYPEAIKNGASHIVNLLTRPRGYRKSRSKLIGIIENIVLRKYAKNYRKAFKERHDIYDATLERLEQNDDKIPNLTFYPDENDIIKNVETRSEVVKKAGDDSFKKASLHLQKKLDVL